MGLRYLILLAVVGCVLTTSGGETVVLRPVSVTATRVADIGETTTRLDSAALRENIALSMAEVLGYNSSLFVKNYGRATLSTVSFRGTSATHTGVTWNGMTISSPMLGTTDFSMIPAYFVDDVRLVHGSSSIAEVGGGLGGLVKLSTDPAAIGEGTSMQFVQGVGSWRTFDEFFRVAYGKGRWRASGRLSFSSSKNDFPFTNHDKKENVYDENHNIVEQYYPRERNRSGAFSDFNGLATVSYDSPGAGRWSADLWYLSSNRQLPVLTTDYSNSFKFDNRQREQTVRGVAKWLKTYSCHSLEARGGYVHTWLAYDYWRETAKDVVSVMTDSRSRVNTFYGAFFYKFFPSSKWYLSVNADFHHNDVASYDYANINHIPQGYSAKRADASAVAEAKWRPSPRWGMGATVRQELHGTKVAVPIPAFFAEGVFWEKIGLTGRGSVSRNYRYPTLNDLYTVPGGNPDLLPEHGFSYDAGMSSAIKLGKGGNWGIKLSATWFDSRINNWIMWLPSAKGFYVPRNARRVHSYGVETEGGVEGQIAEKVRIGLNLNYSYTASVNKSAQGGNDKSYGKQLPYIPLHSGSASLRGTWRGWGMTYRLQAYSERFTMSSNESTLTGKLAPYTVSNIAFDKSFSLAKLEWMAKLAINNLFNADYQTVLSRPMPGINFEIFLSITW